MCVRCDCEEVARFGLCVSMVSFLLLLHSLQLLTLWIFSFFFEFGWCAYLCNAIALSVAGRSRSSAVRRRFENDHIRRHLMRYRTTVCQQLRYRIFCISSVNIQLSCMSTHSHSSATATLSSPTVPAAAGAKFIIDHCNIFCTSTANVAVFYACERTCLVRVTYFSEWASVLRRAHEYYSNCLFIIFACKKRSRGEK